MERCECLPLNSKFARKSVLVKTKPFDRQTVISTNHWVFLRVWRSEVKLVGAAQILECRTKNTLFVTIFPEVAQNSLKIPWVFHVQRNPWVFQVCGHPVSLFTSTLTWQTRILHNILDKMSPVFLSRPSPLSTLWLETPPQGRLQRGKWTQHASSLA